MQELIDTHFPLLITKATGLITVPDVQRMEAFFGNWHARRQRFVLIVDARASGRPDGVTRQAMTDMMKRSLEPTRLYAVGSVVILNSKLAAGALTALRWVIPSPNPERHFTTAMEGFAWLRTLESKLESRFPAGVDDVVTQLDRDWESGRTPANA